MCDACVDVSCALGVHVCSLKSASVVHVPVHNDKSHVGGSSILRSKVNKTITNKIKVAKQQKIEICVKMKMIKQIQLGSKFQTCWISSAST